MWNISFCCRVAKITKDGLAPIEMVITVDGQRSFKRLSMKVSPEEFKRSISCKRDNYIKQYCDSERVKVYEIFRKLEMLGMPITPTIVKEALDNKGITTSYRLSNLQEDFTAIVSRRVGVDLCLNVYKKYERMMKYVVQFLGNKECRLITNSDMKRIVADMKAKYQNSTFANLWVIVKSFITYGINNNRIPNDNLFATIKVVKKPKKVEYLTMEELDRIRKATYSTPSLQRIADFAILEASLGLAYCDLVSIKREDIKEYNGIRYIQKQRAKTGVEYITVVGDEALEILERYNYDISITNQSYNRFLKIVALQAGVGKTLHSHLLRHTFAHHQLNEKHLNIATVSKMLGHTNLKQTMHYCQKHTNTILEEFVIANQG
jgi:integrase